MQQKYMVNERFFSSAWMLCLATINITWHNKAWSDCRDFVMNYYPFKTGKM